MCDCEELDYEDFVVMLKAIQAPSSPVAAMESESPEPKQLAEPVPLVLSTKRKK